MGGVLLQLSISNGGMPKLAIPDARISRDGVAGDWQNNRKYHGGPDQAICLFSEELYTWLRDEHGIDLQPGSVGENFTTRGIEMQQIQAGDRLRVGECLIEITMVRTPCRNLDQWDKRLMGLIKGRSGWKARVIEEGVVRAGDAVEHVKRAGASS
jgi:MOSC domain-containing protein YiiM